ncbi:MAG: M23 family metallopeptidase [Patescibacteria group bacterium]
MGSRRIALYFFLFILAVGACGAPLGDEQAGVSNEDALAGSPSCTLTAARYPTVPGDMQNVYAGRAFYADGNHLGLDIKLAEGTAIHPIGCGILRVYRAASGYGELVAVIEHKLGTPLTVTNGKGEQVTITSFLSIYGHIRKSQDRNGTGFLGLKAGDQVGPDDVIGYVNDDAHNGDGAEHVHLGIRLQTATQAAATETNWFRGYDTTPSQRKWFADPALFMPTLTSNATPVVWHPPGSFLRRPSDGSVWAIDHNLNRHPVDLATVSNERLLDRAIDVTETELGCYSLALAYASPRAGHQVMKFDDASTVYEYILGTSGSRQSFISYDAFLSWGWRDADIAIWPSSQRPAFFASAPDHGLQTFRDGSLVKADGQNEIAVVSEGRRLPIADWPTFLALGYGSEQIVTVPADTIDLVAGPRGALVTTELVGYCAHPSTCIDGCPPPGSGGGEGEVGGAGGAGGAGGESGPVTASSSASSTSVASSSVASSTAASSSVSSSASTGSGIDPNAVPPGKLRFRYDGPVLAGTNQFQGMWDPPGPVFHDWTPATFALCPDNMPNDGILECLLDAPSGTTNFLFTVHLPDGSWWGDMSYDPQGGHGSTIGTVSLEGPNGIVQYVMVSNGSGPDYKNGKVAVIP